MDNYGGLATEFPKANNNLDLTGISRVVYSCYQEEKMDRTELAKLVAETIKSELEKNLKTLDPEMENKTREFLAKVDKQLAESHDHPLAWENKEESQMHIF